MRINSVLASLITLAKLVSSAPADPTSVPRPVSTSTSCIIPLIIVTTIGEPFTLSALTPGFVSWPVQLDPPSETTETTPFISRQTRIPQPLFRLTGGNLTTIGRGASDSEEYQREAFPAYFGPKIQIFPPVPDPIFFGTFQDAYTGFQAGYSCGKDGKAYLELRAGGC